MKIIWKEGETWKLPISHMKMWNSIQEPLRETKILSVHKVSGYYFVTAMVDHAPTKVSIKQVYVLLNSGVLTAKELSLIHI